MSVRPTWPKHIAPLGLLGGYTLEAATPAFSLLPKVISLKEGDFFFDSLRQVSDWVKKNRPQKEGEGTCLWKGWLPAASLERFQTPPSILAHSHVSLDMQMTNFLQGERPG